MRWAEKQDDWRALRPFYAERCQGRPISNAVEILSSATALFTLTGPNPREAILRSVNFGRACDCRPYVCSTFAAALAGPAGLPQEWIDTLEEEIMTDPCTVSRRSLGESAAGLYRALLAERERARVRVALLDEATE